ncbi:hypothetical protein GCM10009765_39910 [Fodinicola feengrottensis]|uniref:Uncharacterized protein n=1 Tax=Fodinicola feengrottensis TaxID=435914 RepID=A0ABP4TFF4_9ACTN
MAGGESGGTAPDMPHPLAIFTHRNQPNALGNILPYLSASRQCPNTAHVNDGKWARTLAH